MDTVEYMNSIFKKNLINNRNTRGDITKNCTRMFKHNVLATLSFSVSPGEYTKILFIFDDVYQFYTSQYDCFFCFRKNGILKLHVCTPNVSDERQTYETFYGVRRTPQTFYV